MDFTLNMTSTSLLSGMELNPHDIQLPVTLVLAGFIAASISFLAYLSYSPRVDKKSPAFTSDTVLYVGSWRFFTHKL